MSSVSQLGARPNTDTKQAGDSVLNLYGASSTQVIRSLWERPAHGEVAFRQFVEMLEMPPAAGATIHPVSDEEDANDSFLSSYQAFVSEAGLDPSTYAPLTDEELEDLVYQDYLEERAKQMARHAS